jgi:predicted phosphodiesterase
MRIAVLSDIHSNIWALKAAARRIDELSVDRLLCLGDIVGYNAAPQECLDWIREHDVEAVKGNHDVDVAADEPVLGTSSAARAVQRWTKDKLRQESQEYLASLPALIDDSPILAVHGCYLNDDHYYGYVTPTMLRTNIEAVVERGAAPNTIALCGHTHQPLVGWLDRGEVVNPKPLDQVRWPRTADVVLINPGAIGQPRDRDPRACFAVIDTEQCEVRYERVEYPIEEAVARSKEFGLPDGFAERLRAGS